MEMILSWLNTSKQIEAEKPDLAILPLASLQNSAEEFPQDASYRIVSEIARQVALKCSKRVFLLPCWPYGTQSNSGGKQNGVPLGYKAFWAVVKDVVESLLQHDIHQVVIINDLGTSNSIGPYPAGNEILKTAVRQLNYENPGLHAVWIEPFRVGRDSLKAVFPSVSTEHMNTVVKSAMLMVLFQRSAGSLEELPSWCLQDISSKKGEQAFLAICAAITEYIEKTGEFLKDL